MVANYNAQSIGASPALSAPGTFIPASVGGSGTIDSSLADWLAFGALITGSATVIAEGSYDGTTNWMALALIQESTGYVVQSVTASGHYFAQTPAPFTRLRATAVSGSAQITGGTTDVQDAPVIAGPNPAQAQPTVPAAPAVTDAAITPFKNTAVSSALVSVKNSAAARVRRARVFNSNSGPVYLQMFDAATTAAVALGTTVPKEEIPVPAGALFNESIDISTAFASGLQILASTTSAGNAGSVAAPTAPTTPVHVQLWNV